MLKPDDLARAHHEAGHAVMNWLVGATVERITIERTAEGGGAVHPGGPKLSTRDELWTYLAGPEAHSMFNEKRGVIEIPFGANDDEAQIELLLQKLGEETDVLRRSHEQRVRQKLSEPDISAGLHALAAALVTAISLDGDSARLIFENGKRGIIKQPDDHTCGQCCIAMATGKTLVEAIEIVGHAHGTKRAEIVAALKRCGLSVVETHVPAVPRPLRDRISKRCILQVCYQKVEDCHWIYFDGEFKDPDPLNRFDEQKHLIASMIDLTGNEGNE